MARLSGGHWETSSGCGKAVYRMWGDCLEGVGKLSGGVGWLSRECEEAVRAWRGHLEGYGRCMMVWGGCLHGVGRLSIGMWRLSGRCGEAV